MNPVSPESLDYILSFKFQGTTTLTIRLGPMTLTRRDYRCSSCQTGFFPKDRTMGVDGASVTSGLLRTFRRARLLHRSDRSGLSLPGFPTAWPKAPGVAGFLVEQHHAFAISRPASEPWLRLIVLIRLGDEIAEDERTFLEPDPVTLLPSALYLGMDGTGIPMRPEELADGSSKTREVKLCSVWSAEKSDSNFCFRRGFMREWRKLEFRLPWRKYGAKYQYQGSGSTQACANDY